MDFGCMQAQKLLYVENARFVPFVSSIAMSILFMISPNVGAYPERI
jgi:hypothetical protein